MYKCLNCGVTFEEGKLGYTLDGEETMVCPECEIDDWEILHKCEMCHEEYITSEKDRCYTCEKTTALWLEEAIGNIQSDTGAERSEVIRALGDWIEKS